MRSIFGTLAASRPTAPGIVQDSAAPPGLDAKRTARLAKIQSVE